MGENLQYQLPDVGVVGRWGPHDRWWDRPSLVRVVNSCGVDPPHSSVSSSLAVGAWGWGCGPARVEADLWCLWQLERVVGDGLYPQSAGRSFSGWQGQLDGGEDPLRDFEHLLRVFFILRLVSLNRSRWIKEATASLTGLAQLSCGDCRLHVMLCYVISDNEGMEG